MRSALHVRVIIICNLYISTNPGLSSFGMCAPCYAQYTQPPKDGDKQPLSLRCTSFVSSIWEMTRVGKNLVVSQHQEDLIPFLHYKCIDSRIG